MNILRIINPIMLFFIGSLIGISPYFFGGDYFDMYKSFSINKEILLVYLIGFLSFAFGSVMVHLIYKKPACESRFIKKDYNIILYSLILISLVVFTKIIALYGSLPILSILLGDEIIAFVNETQKDVGGGLYGVFFLMIVSLIILFPYSIIYKNNSKANYFLFWIHFFLLLLYSTYSGKRQMMFMLFTYTFTYLLIFYNKNRDYKVLQKIKLVGIVTFSILVTVFLTVGLIRSNLMNEEVSLIDPIIHYASLPFINLTSIISNVDSNQYMYSFNAFYELLLSDLPTFFKSIFISEYKTLNMPLIEPTSPPTIYGMIFWSFGYMGVFVYLYLVGGFVSYLYLKAVNNKNYIFITLYSLTVWPLLSIHTYNHFKNFMFLIIPLSMVVIGTYIYKKILKRE